MFVVSVGNTEDLVHRDGKISVKVNHKIPFCIPQPEELWLPTYRAIIKQIES